MGVPLESLVRRVLESKTKELLPKIIEIIDSLAENNHLPSASAPPGNHGSLPGPQYTSGTVGLSSTGSLAPFDRGSLPLPIDIPGLSAPKKSATEQSSSVRPKPKTTGDGKKVHHPPLAGEGKKAPPTLTTKATPSVDRASKGDPVKAKDRPKAEVSLADDRDRHVKAPGKDKAMIMDGSWDDSRDKTGGAKPAAHATLVTRDVMEDKQGQRDEGTDKATLLAGEERNEDRMEVCGDDAKVSTSLKKTGKRTTDPTESSTKDPHDGDQQAPEGNGRKDGVRKEQKEKRESVEHCRDKKEQKEKKDQRQPKDQKDQVDHQKGKNEQKEQMKGHHKDHPELKDSKERREAKEKKELKEHKEQKEPNERMSRNEIKGPKERKEKELKDQKECKEHLDHYEMKELKEKKEQKEWSNNEWKEAEEKRDKKLKERRERKELKEHLDHTELKESKERKELKHADHTELKERKELKEVKDQNMKKDHKERKEPKEAPEQDKQHKEHRRVEEGQEEGKKEQQESRDMKDAKKESSEQKEGKDGKKQKEQKAQMEHSVCKAQNQQKGRDEQIEKEVMPHEELKEPKEPNESPTDAKIQEVTIEEESKPAAGQAKQLDAKDEELAPRRRSSRLLSLSDTSEGKASIEGESSSAQKNSAAEKKRGGQRKNCLQSSSPDIVVPEAQDSNDGCASDSRGEGWDEADGEDKVFARTKKQVRKRTGSQGTDEKTKRHKVSGPVSATQEKHKPSPVVVTRYNRQVKRNRKYSPSSELGTGDLSPVVTDNEFQADEMEERPSKKSRNNAKK